MGFPLLASTKTLLIKLGTRVVTQSADNCPDELATDRLYTLVEEISQLQKTGIQCLLVSSGAVGLGRKKLGLGSKKLTLAQKQAAAAVGQAYLMNFYCEAFQKHNIQTAQVLVTSKDFSNRSSLLNLSRLFDELAQLNVVPILNENDSTSISEISEEEEKSFGDNDRLAALLASQFSADLLILLSDVDGVYTENPLINPQAKKIDELKAEDFKKNKINFSGAHLHSLSRGGMSSKVEAALLASESGVTTIIASGFKAQVLTKCLNAQTQNELPGTIIPPQSKNALRKRWLAWMSGYQGSVVVDEGAQNALKKGKSLLFAGIKSVSGTFSPDSVIRILDEEGQELGRGLSQSSDEFAQLCLGKKSDEISFRFNSLCLVPNTVQSTTIFNFGVRFLENQEEADFEYCW